MVEAVYDLGFDMLMRKEGRLFGLSNGGAVVNKATSGLVSSSE